VNLTQAEWAVLAKVAEGKSNKAIARERGATPVTVRDQVESILHKLGVANRTQAAAVYLKAQI
jgi:two-component system NarL family response regulator